MQRGFALLTVLVFLVIFSLMSLYALMAVSDSLKITGHEWQRDKNLILAQQLLVQIEGMLPSQNCMIPTTSPASFRSMPLDEWASSLCSGNLDENQYYYGIESLGEDACSSIHAQFFRVTLIFLPVMMPETKMILQSTIALAGKGEVTCDGNKHASVIGRQMWREI